MKNKQCFFGEYHIYSFFRYLASIFIVLISVNGGIFGATLPKCTADINEVDINAIQLATTSNNTNKLFLIVKKDEFDKGNMCYTATDSYVKCETTRIKGVGNCTDKIVCESGYSVVCDGNGCKCKNQANVEGKFVVSEKCDDFNNYISYESKDTSLDKACYPENHICLKYGSYYKNNEMLYHLNIEKDSYYVNLNGNYVKCDAARRVGCTDKIACESGYSVVCDENGCKCKKGTKEKEFTEKGNYDDFNNYISYEIKDSRLKKACYLENHMCLSNKEVDIGNNSEFYVYKKNIINSGNNKNCEFHVFSCDYKIRNESVPALNAWQNQVNLVASGTANDNNKLFVENIFGSLGNMSFFIQAGECDVSNGTCSGNCSRDNGNNQCSIAEVIKKSYYYKYYDSNRNVLFYYEKNIATGKENNIGRICNKYLPNCVDLRPNDSMVVLYQNKSTGANNVEARKNFYKNSISDSFSVNEANLYYLSSPGAADVLCLSKEGASNIDVGYCSDIGTNGSLKYRDGLTLAYFKKDNTVKPNCYLKSCIDLTPEEFEVIKREGKIDKKYCSEYYWLSNSKGLKYFPKEKPIYCSDIENGHLKFFSFHGTEKFCDKYKCAKYNNKEECIEVIEECAKEEKSVEYYAGGGLDREKGNCYLKNCYSLTKDERKLVADAKINNIGLEIERACLEGSNCDYKSNFKYDNLPVYCDNGFLFNKDTPGYTNFEPINLNVIPCYAFQENQLANIGAERVLLFTELIGKDGKHGMGDKKYDADSNVAFCRTHYVPLNLINNANDNNTKASFLRTRVILANEKAKVSGTTYLSKLADWGITNYESEIPENFGIKYFHDDMGYQKVKFTSRKLDRFKNVNNYMNILSFVENVFPYYNADLAGIQSADIFNGNEIIGFKINTVKQKNSGFLNCLNDESRKNSKQSKDDDLTKNENCKDCVGGKDGISQEECLYNKKNKDNEKICMKYVPLDYECKREYCDSKNNITKNYCYIEDFAKEKMSNADFYITKTDSTAYLDCSLYAYAAAGSEEYKKFTTGIISDFLEEVGKDKLDIIKAACDDLLPIVDDRKLPKASILQQVLKPNKVDINFADSSGSPGKHDLERYGCTKFNKVNLHTHGLYGCKLPDVDSSYFNTILNPVNLYNGSKKPTEKKITNLSVCSRYQNDVLGESSKCGQREGSQYGDKCLDFSLDVSDRNSNTLDDSPQKSKWIFEESTGGSRFRTFRENRDIYAIRDFHTYHYCSATKNFKGEDDVGSAYVYAAGVAAGAAIGAVACPSGCIPGCIFSLFATGACIAICIPVCIVATAAVTGAIYLAARYDQWNLNLQNDLQIARGYNSNNYQNKGFITPTLVTDNNNYIYRFYSRSENIEEDLANKLNANSGYFKENTLGVDILKKCGVNVKTKVEETKDEEGKKTGEIINFGLLELTKSDHNNDMGYSFNYKIKKFENDGKVSSDDCGESDIKNCLNEKQRKCIEGYGVSFFDGNFIKDVDKNFMLNEGGFLVRYNKGDIAKDDWGSLASPSNKNRNWLPVDVVYNTMNMQASNNTNCKIGLFGDPIGDLSRCRGFSLDCRGGSDNKICNKLGTQFNGTQTFFTESQALKLPLAGHPFFFYTLLTPKNTPEMFDPSIFVKEFCEYNADASSCKEGKSMTPNDGLNKLVLNFFEPILKIGYEYNGGVANDDFKNHYTQYNNFISYISSLNNSSSDNYSYSCPYQVKYKSNYIQTERQYIYVLHRTFEQGAHDEYIPKVCLYRIVDVKGNNSINTIYNFYVGKKCSKKDGVLQKNGYIIIDNNVMCFPRTPLSFDNLVLAESPNINYNRPYINSKITDKNRRVDYKLRQNDKDYNIMDFGENRDLGFGLNFTRSYCSKLYYDYYKYVDQLEKSGDTLDQATINRINKSINSIESYIRSDCDKENGYESEFLINESKMKSKIDDENKNILDSEVVFKETAIVRKNNKVYGGFNELCVSDYDIDNIFNINKEYAISGGLTDFPEVFAFASDNNDGVDTKCLLSDSSREDISCMVTDRFAYLYLTKAEEENYSVNCEDGKCKKGVSGCNEEQCRLYVNVDSLERIPLKRYECILENGKVNPELLTDVNNITDEIAEKISACYGGGFNYAGIVHDSIDSNKVKMQCKCKIANGVSNYNNKVLKIRAMTPREYGLCIDLKKPIICPAVRYYDSSKTYVDDNLALGKIQEEMDKNGEQKYYEQHLWRTAEKISGIIPSVFYSNTLGHAEFPASIYCEDKKDCLGGSKNVTGSCLGYWKNGDTIPTAICEVKKYKGKNVYEYKLKNGTECVRYRCPGISGNDYLDEFEIDKNTSNVFTTAEITDFNNIKRTDYRSFINNEEIDVYSVDKRGLSNGFAAWRELESGDFAKDRYEIEGDIFVNCLTGYGLAGSNNRILNALLVLDENTRNKIKGYYKTNEKYFNNNLMDNNNRRSIYNSMYDKAIIIGQNSYVNDKPKRYCNQKGEWMPVEDVYNKMILDSSNLGNNLYHSGVTDLWLDIFNKERTYTISNVLDENTSLIDKVSRYGYCERLVCRGIEQPDENYYIDEFFNEGSVNSKTKDIYKFWLHSGGANWKVTSAPRNSSNNITNDPTADPNSSEFSSMSLTNIFSSTRDSEFDDYIIGNKYKYLKKVKGECKKEFGYYNRGTSFSLTTVTDQIGVVNELEVNENDKTKCILDKELCVEKCVKLGIDTGDCGKRCSEDNLACEKCVDSRKATNFAADDPDEDYEPYRVCTSVGLWGEVNNKCVRSCELLHLYRTNINSDLYSSDRPNNVYNPNLKVENHDIIFFNSSEKIKEGYMEGRFLMYNFRNKDLKNKNNYTEGESIFGGANWARTIVSDINGSNKYDCDSNGKCLRYIEVEGECNGEYETKNISNPTQYVNSAIDSNNNPIKPIRKCYEDGTWGEVRNKCVLEKTCVPLPLHVSDVTELIKKYNNVSSDLSNLNDTLSKIYVNYIKGESKNKNDYKLLEITAKNATAGLPISCNGIESFVGIEPVDDIKRACSSADCCGNEVSMVCNSSDKLGNYVAGWSFNTLELEKYFIPNTCGVTIKRDLENNNTYFKTNPSSIKDSFTCSNFDDLSKKIDRLNFIFANKVANYPIGIPAKHYAKESKFNLVYNNLNNINIENNYSIEYTNKISENTNINDLSNKTVNINGSLGERGGANKVYHSYQIYATCDNRYFYNEVSGSNYYNKLAIFSCQREDNCQNNCFKFKPDNDTNNSKYLLKSERSLADACKPKTCGDINLNNPYQKGWSLGYIEEFVDNSTKKYDNTNSHSKFSKLMCPDKYAFVMKNMSELDDSLNVESYFSSNGKSYKAYGFVSSLKSTCNAKRSENVYNNTNEPQEVWNDDSKSSFKIINGKTTDNAYDANRYGDLNYEDLPKTFCKDIAKNNCQTITEAEAQTKIINNGSTFKKEFDNDGNGYCVRMGCPRLNLRIVNTDSGLKALKNGNATANMPGNFALPRKNDNADDYYDFDDVVVIQSLNGDYNGSKSCFGRWCYRNPDSPYGNNVIKFVQYDANGGSRIGDNLCGNNQDIYNEGVGEYTYNSYLSAEENKNNQTNIVSCFENLYSKGSLNNYQYENGYIKINDSLYVKYNNYYINKLAVVNNIHGENISGYAINTEKAKTNANNLLKKTVFSKIKVNEVTKDEVIVDKIVDEEKINIEVLNNYAEDQKDIIDDYALAETKKMYDIKPDDYSYLCLFDTKYPDKDGNYVELKDIEELTDKSSRFTDEEHKLYKCVNENSCTLNDKYIFIKGGNESEQVKFNISEKNASITDVRVSSINQENCSKTITATYNFTAKKYVPKEKNNIIKKYCSIKDNCSCDNNGENCTYNNGLTKTEIMSEYCNANTDDNDNCESKDEIEQKEKTITVNGSYYLKLEDFEGEFLKVVTNKIDSLKSSFDASSSNHGLNKLYNKIYNFYKVENYFKESGNACRIKHYNDFLELIGVDAQIYVEKSGGEQIVDFDNCSNVPVSDSDNIIFSYLISVNEPTDDDYTGPIESTRALFNYTKYIEGDGMSCRKYSDNISKEECGLSLITEPVLNVYKKYFLNIFEKSNNNGCSDISECNVIATINYYNKIYQDEKNKCERIYGDFLNKKFKDNEKNAGKIKTGLFMVMKCTPEGWIVEGKPTCKNRCSTNGATGVLGKNDNDIGRLTGNYDVEVYINNLRYSKEIDIKYNSAFRSTCVKGVAMSACKYEYKFTNDGSENCSLQKITTQCGSKADYGDNITYNYDSYYKTSKVCRRCSAHSYFNSVDNGEMIWGSVDGVSDYCHTKDYLTCLPCPNGSHICKNGGSGSRNVDYCGSNYDAVTTIGYKIYR